MDTEKLYTLLFNGITDAIQQLQELQLAAEACYMEITEEAQ